MNAKLVLISFYIVFIYWISSLLPAFHALFYPTLGAFSLLLATRDFDLRAAVGMLIGATVASAIGTLLHALQPGGATLLVDTLLVAWLIQRFRWNAPPILAVSIIPFFVPQSNLWLAPSAVFVSLLGLIALLTAARQAAAWKRAFTLRGSMVRIRAGIGTAAPDAD